MFWRELRYYFPLLNVHSRHAHSNCRELSKYIGGTEERQQLEKYMHLNRSFILWFKLLSQLLRCCICTCKCVLLHWQPVPCKIDSPGKCMAVSIFWSKPRCPYSLLNVHVFASKLSRIVNLHPCGGESKNVNCPNKHYVNICIDLPFNFFSPLLRPCNCTHICMHREKERRAFTFSYVSHSQDFRRLSSR